MSAGCGRGIGSGVGLIDFMNVYQVNGNPNGNLNAGSGDQAFDHLSGPPYNYIVCQGGTVWNAFNVSGSPSGAWVGVISTVSTYGGAQLGYLRQMLNAEIDEELDETISPAGIDTKNQKLNNQQAFLANQHTYLLGKTRVSLQLNAGQQYYNLPSGIDFDHLDKPQYTTIASGPGGNNIVYEIGFGIDQPEYAVFPTSTGSSFSPCLKWDLVTKNGFLQIEVWPIPNTAQTLEFSGLLPITQMVNDTDVCVIDGMAIVLFTAAEMLAKSKASDAQAKLAKAQAYLASLRSGKPSKFETFNMMGKQFPYVDNNKNRPVIATSISLAP